MAAGTLADFKLYDDQVHSGIVEKVTQNLNLFNDASNGAIRLIDKRMQGQYSRSGFFKGSGFVTRRDPTLVTVVADTKFTEAETIGVKINRKVGPIAHTRDSLQKILINDAGGDPRVLSALFGSFLADEMMQDQVNNALRAVVAALRGQPTNVHTIAANGTLVTGGLIDALALQGDKSGEIVQWIMHSKAWFNLVKDQAVTTQTVGVSNLVVANGMPITLNRPVLVIDSPALVINSGSGSTAVTDYIALGLKRDAATVVNSEQETMALDRITGLENLLYRLQGEFAYNLEVMGFAWDTANGGVNPTDAAVATTTNWDAAATVAAKNFGGVVIQTR